MQVIQLNSEEFFEIIKELDWQNQDIKESWGLGYKSPEDAFKRANTSWARFYIVKHRTKVLTAILEQRDGHTINFTTTDLPSHNIARYIKLMTKLSDKIIKHRDVLFVEVAPWYTGAKRLLRLTGFRVLHKSADYERWYKDNGKQD